MITQWHLVLLFMLLSLILSATRAQQSQRQRQRQRQLLQLLQEEEEESSYSCPPVDDDVPCSSIDSWQELRIAVNRANAGDTIVLCQDIIKQRTEPKIFFVHKSIRLACKAGHSCVIRGGGSHFEWNGNSRVILQDIAFEGATDRSIYVYTGTGQHLICNCRFEGNRNTFFKRGAALTGEIGTRIIVIGSTFIDNLASQGPAIYMRGSTMEVYDSYFHNNEAQERGSAIGTSPSAQLILVGNTFETNVARLGGPVYVHDNNMWLDGGGNSGNGNTARIGPDCDGWFISNACIEFKVAPPTTTPTTLEPSVRPTFLPTTGFPVAEPTAVPTTGFPVAEPTFLPVPTASPSMDLTTPTTLGPVDSSSIPPTTISTSVVPTIATPTTTTPSLVTPPTLYPSGTPIAFPTSAPTSTPIASPTSAPTSTPMASPTSAPTFAPTFAPTLPPSTTPANACAPPVSSWCHSSIVTWSDLEQAIYAIPSTTSTTLVLCGGNDIVKLPSDNKIFIDNNRVVTIQCRENQVCKLSGGHGSYLEISGSGTRVILQDVTLEGATDRAVYVYSGTQQHVICRVLFQRNKNAVVKRGAALTVERGTNVLVVESRFVDNEASQGSGIYARGGTVEVYDSVFEDNVALERGGAIGLSDSAHATLFGTAFYGNSALKGGAIMMYNTETLIDSGGNFAKDNVDDNGPNCDGYTVQNTCRSFLDGPPRVRPTSPPTVSMSPTAAADKRVRFYAMGDTPYNAGEHLLLVDQVLRLSKDEAEFVVHVGDMQRRYGYCGNATYEIVRNTLQGGKLPTFITPGDNDWYDCSDYTEALERFNFYFGDLDQTWPHNFAVQYQAARRENFLFLHKEVMFASLHVARASHFKGYEELNARTNDNLAWLRHAIRSHTSVCMVLFCHAFPLLPHYETFYNGLVALANEYNKPILYIQGDYHVWHVDRPFTEAQNIQRIVVNNGGDENPVWVAVDPASSSAPFSWVRR